MTDFTAEHDINEALADRVRARTGLSGHVRIVEEAWDWGLCETCSYPEDGFSVWVGDTMVWPSTGYLREEGGYVYADEDGSVVNGTLVLSLYGYFDKWLNGAYQEEN